MYRLLTPILAVIVAVSLFATYIKPQFDEYKRIDVEKGDYDQALSKAQELQDRISELSLEMANIPQSNIERLQALLPDSLDEVAVVLSLDATAQKHRLILENIQTKNPRKQALNASDTKTPTSPVVNNPFAKAPPAATNKISADTPDTNVNLKDFYDTTDISFSVTGKYTDFREFIADLEKSLVLMDLSSLTIAETADGDASTYTATISMYQFKGK